MSLAIKHRPRSLKTVIGNTETVEALKQVLAKKKKDIPKSFLFIGPSGCGKTTLARIVAKELGCNKADYYELDTADFRGIDTVRELRKADAVQALVWFVPCVVVG